MGLRILVCGGREYCNRNAIWAALDRLHGHRGIAMLIHGAARGADSLAAEWAKARRDAGEAIEIRSYPADWHRYGRAAGGIRNQHMLDDARPDGVVAFPGGWGTADMVRRASGAGLKVWRPAGE